MGASSLLSLMSAVKRQTRMWIHSAGKCDRFLVILLSPVGDSPFPEGPRKEILSHLKGASPLLFYFIIPLLYGLLCSASHSHNPSSPSKHPLLNTYTHTQCGWYTYGVPSSLKYFPVVS